MWQVENHTPFAASGYFLRNARGGEHWVVAMRATLDLSPDGLPVRAEEQQPVRMLPLYSTGHDELIEDSDFAPFRPQCDILMYGTATPPEARQLRFPVSLSVGAMRRRIYCHGPRQISRTRLGHRLEQLGPAVPTPLSWRQAAGGTDPYPDQAEAPVNADNPVGMGWTAVPGRMPRGDQLRLAALDALPDCDVKDLASPRPAGFGAIAPWWRPRLALAGTCDAQWEQTRHPLPPLDFDDRFHQVAPNSQSSNLRGGEVIALENAGRPGFTRMRLPQIIAEVQTFMGAQRITTRMRLISLVIRADERRMSMVWNAALACPGQDMQISQSTVRVTQSSGLIL